MKQKIETLVPYSEAKVFRTSTGFVVQDKDDEEWCKFLPFDDLDRVQTNVALRTLEPARIAAMDAMPLPTLAWVSQDQLKDFEKDFEQICIQDQVQNKDEKIETVQISSLRTTEDDIPTEPIRQPFMTLDDLILSQFEESQGQMEPTTHFPMRNNTRNVNSGSGRSPLSYQQTVLQDDPILTEDFDRKKAEDEESLIVSATSQYASEDETDDDDLPSSLRPSQFEQDLYQSTKQIKKGTKEGRKETESFSEDEDWERNYDIDDWSLLKNSMPKHFLLNGLITTIVSIVLFIGIFVQINTVILFGLFALFNYSGKRVYQGISSILGGFKRKYFRQTNRKKKRFTNKQESPSDDKKDENKPAFESISPLGGFKVSKPPGSAGTRKKVRRVLHVNPIRVSEARVVKHTDHRHYLIVKFFEKMSKYALLDPGSCCCIIHPEFLKQLQQISYIPVEESKFEIQGIVSEVRKSANKVAYLDFQLETGYWVRNVPFLVYASDYDILIGNNLVCAQRWASTWKDSDFYIDLGQSQPLVPTYFKNSTRNPVSTSAVLVSDVTVFPGEMTSIELEIPQIMRKRETPFKEHELLVEPLEATEEDDLWEILPSVSRLENKKVFTTIRNNSKEPVTLMKGDEMAKVTTVAGGKEILSMEEFMEASRLFNTIPQITTTSCHCEIAAKTPDHEESVKILISDPLGNTSIGNLLNPNNPEKLTSGIHIIPKEGCKIQGKLNDTALVLLVTDDDYGLGEITRVEIRDAKKKLAKILTKEEKKVSYYFLNPLKTVSFTTRMVMNDLHKEIPFLFFPVQAQAKHEKCSRPSVSMNIPKLLTGATKTKIYIQTGSAMPPKGSLIKEHSTPEKIIPFGQANLILFRQESSLMVHFHIPRAMENVMDFTKEETRNHLIRWMFSELQQLRVPTDMEINLNQTDLDERESIPLKYYQNQLRQIIKEIPYFPQPSARKLWPCRLSEGKPEQVEAIIKGCKCSLCTLNEKKKHGGRLVKLYDGDINHLIDRLKRKDSKSSSSFSNISSSSRVTSRMKAKIASLCDIGEDFDTDQPLDPMQLCTEEEMEEFLNDHPGEMKELDEGAENLPPPQKSDPSLFDGFDMEGIPDQFRPGNWRETDIMNRLKNVPEHIKKSFGELLDKHVNTISYHPTDCRPVLLHGKPAVVDVKLKTDQPIFSKPYMVNGAAVDIMDKKLLELYNKGEIAPIESNYNTAVIFTHHNSSQKHVKGIDKQVRVVLDVRKLNGQIEEKNIHSHLVKAVEHLFMILFGNKWFTAADVARAYRALIASFRLRQLTAFRCPSSRIFPQVTFAFRSACDGLANLPGFYSYLVQEALTQASRECTVAHIDDLLIFSKTMEEHLNHIDKVFTDLGRQNFMISAKKLQPFQREVLFLGHIIDGVHKWIPEEKKSYFDSIELPKTKKDIQKLMGIANYLSPYINSYGLLVIPLYDAMKGKTDKQPIQLNEIQTKSFLQLKKMISEAPKLSLLDVTKPIYLEVDASLTGCGSILYQMSQDENGKDIKNIIRYGSRRYSITESLHHQSLEREAMAIIVGVRQHLPFLMACPEVIIKTDLKSLITILSCFNNPESPRMSRIAAKIYSFPFKWQLIHIPGVDLPIADALSRIHKPYTCLYPDKHLRYPDLKRENIMMPPEWRQNPDLILTTQDLLEAMRQQTCFIEKSSSSVKEKRLKALINEVTLLYDELGPNRDQLAEALENDLLTARKAVQKEHAWKKTKTHITALTAVPTRTLITPKFIVEHQNANPKLHNVITMLRTTPKDRIPVRIMKKFRLLNDSILITRKNRTLPFDHPGNLRIVCDAKMTIHMLALIHVMSCHHGMNTLNHLFTNTYKCIEGSTQGYVKLICTGCRSCRFHRNINKRNLPEKRVPLPHAPNEVWMVDFMVFKQEQTFKGKKMTAAFNIMDLFSNLLISYPTKDQQSDTVINCLKQTFAMFNIPRKIVSDNAQALFINPDVIQFLKNNNIQIITTTTAHNSKSNKVERLHKIFRETLQLVKETFRRETQFDMYFTVVQMINSRPLTLSLHPNVKNICKDIGTEPGVITPYSLHFGLPLAKHPLIPLENTLNQDDRQEFREKWKYIIKHHDMMLQQELDERNEDYKGRTIELGELVLVRNMVAHKEQLKYYKEIYEVVKINKARYFCAPLFTKGPIMQVNANNLKPYTYNTLYESLPDNIRTLMGENLSPQELKKQSKENPNLTPADFQNWRQWRPPTIMNLRNRITPADKSSEPALSIVDTDFLSDDSNESTILSIPDDIPDGLSELSSMLNTSGVSQLRTTNKGLLRKSYKIPQIQTRVPTKTLEQQALTLEEVQKNWDQKKLKAQRKIPQTPVLHEPVKKQSPTKTPESIQLPQKQEMVKQSADNTKIVAETTNYPEEDVIQTPATSPKETVLKETVLTTPEKKEEVKQHNIEEKPSKTREKSRSRLGKLLDDSADAIKRSISRSKSRESIVKEIVTAPKSPKQVIQNIAERLRRRSKIRRPFRFMDPDFTK